MSFTKLFSSITDSTIWDAPHHVRIVWVTLLAMADKHGQVLASIPGLAHRARVTLDECQEALSFLRQPDIYSRTQEHDGRRIATIDGGWHLLNHAKYRALQVAETAKESKRAYAERKRLEQLASESSTSFDSVRPRSQPFDSYASVAVVCDQDPSLAGSRSDQDPPSDAHASARAVYRNLDGWSPSEELYADAAMAGLDRKLVDERIAELRNGPIGGRRGVFDRDDYVRGLFPKWRTWRETAHSSAVHRPGSTNGARSRVGKGGAFGPVLEPKQKHVRFARHYGIDLAAVIAELGERRVVETLGTDAFHEHMEKLLAREAKKRIDAGLAKPPRHEPSDEASP